MNMIQELIDALLLAMEKSVTVTFTMTVEKKRQEAKTGNYARNTVSCPNCNWKHTYSRANNARKGYEAHMKSCRVQKPTAPVIPLWVEEQTKEKNNRGK